MSSSVKSSPRARKTRVTKATPEVVIPSLVPIAALFGPCLAKVQFPDKETDFQAFRVLRRSGYAYERFRGNVYGVISEKQLKLLNKHKIPYKIVG